MAPKEILIPAMLHGKEELKLQMELRLPKS